MNYPLTHTPCCVSSLVAFPTISTAEPRSQFDLDLKSSTCTSVRYTRTCTNKRRSLLKAEKTAREHGATGDADKDPFYKDTNQGV